MLCSMLAFCCNRRHSAIQIQNSMTFLACGVTQKVNDYLHFLGLTSSRATALEAMDTLKMLTEKKIKEMGSTNYKIRPIWCVDNIDIEARIHDKKVEANSRVFHGTWGYLHEVPDHLIQDMTAEDLDLKIFLEAMERSKVEPVNLTSLLPTMKEEEHFELVQKAQISKAFLKHCLDKGSKEEIYSKGVLPTSPPKVDPIQMYDPKIIMFKMMSASDNSSTGIGQLIEQILKQLDVEPMAFGKWMQLVEGDMGTNMNFEGAARKRYPPGHSEEGLQNISLGLAGSHTMWNITSSIVNHYAGDKDDSDDTGVRRCASALIIDPNHLVDKADFGLMMQAVHRIQTASFVFILK